MNILKRLDKNSSSTHLKYWSITRTIIEIFILLLQYKQAREAVLFNNPTKTISSIQNSNYLKFLYLSSFTFENIIFFLTVSRSDSQNKRTKFPKRRYLSTVDFAHMESRSCQVPVSPERAACEPCDDVDVIIMTYFDASRVSTAGEERANCTNRIFIIPMQIY